MDEETRARAEELRRETVEDTERLNRRVPRREEGGASAPPDAAAEQRWECGHALYMHTNLQAQECLTMLQQQNNARPQATGPVAAADFCAEAARLVGGQRAATHGDKLINFANIAELWNGYWRIKCRVADERLSTPFTAHDVGCMMELFKIARRFSGSYNADDYVDAAGYAGCTGEIAAREQTPSHTRRAHVDPAP